jgi:hypothetical protein
MYVVKALVANVLIAHTVWDWGKNERSTKLLPSHAMKTKMILIAMITDTRQLMTLPTFTRGRHRFTHSGMNEAKSFWHIFHSLSRRITFSIAQLHRQVEVMKAAGLPGNEAARINQYHWLLQGRIEKLGNIKVVYINHGVMTNEK